VLEVLRKGTQWYVTMCNVRLLTYHNKAQGTTALNGVVALPSVGTPWARGLEYVICTRQTMLEYLILITPLRAGQFQSLMPKKHQLDRIE
jgi:hypothetical protein